MHDAGIGRLCGNVDREASAVEHHTGRMDNENQQATLLECFLQRHGGEPVGAKERLEICINCDRLLKVTMQCKECLCFVKLKTKVRGQHCPLGKW
jgi:hypothetical protein